MIDSKHVKSYNENNKINYSNSIHCSDIKRECKIWGVGLL